MKVSLGMNLKHGAWGGGNQFGHSLSKYLIEKGCEVKYDLKANDLSIIVLIDPRIQSVSASYNAKDIFEYLSQINSNTIVLHRINECDERKGTRDINQQLISANSCADHTVFVATWLKNLFVDRGLPCDSRSVILNGSNSALFNSNGYSKWDGKTPLKIISHHWSSNWLKGFDIYERLDRMLGEPEWKKKIEYIYVGNLPEGFQFNNASYIPPKCGEELSDTLRSSHVYLTASRNEPGGHHQNEGARCGLPLLYIESGCMPEYCSGFGISFNTENFEKKLKEMIKTYDYWREKMPDYPHTAEKMCGEYYTLFKKLIENKDEILSLRKPIRKASIVQKTSYHFKEKIEGIKSLVRIMLRKN